MLKIMLFPFKNAKLFQFMPNYFRNERKQRDHVATKIAHALSYCHSYQQITNKLHVYEQRWKMPSSVYMYNVS